MYNETDALSFINEYLALSKKYGLDFEPIFSGEFTHLKYSQGENNYTTISYFSNSPIYPEEVEKKLLALNGSVFNLNKEYEADDANANA